MTGIFFIKKGSMSKDPAFLFYYQDFIVGTAFMSFVERGAYITILCYMADKGPMTINQITQIIGPNGMTDTLKDKFTEKNGLWFNKRLFDEISKRKSFCASRRANRMSNICETSDSHMENENENKNVIKLNKDRGVGKGFVRPTVDEVKAYCLEKKNGIDPIAFHAHYEANGWVQGRNKPIKNWKACMTTWEQNKKKDVGFSAQPPVTGKPQAEVAVLELIVLKWDDSMIKERLLSQGYAEHRIDEAIMKARGAVR